MTTPYNPLSDERLDAYTITFRQEIAFYLRQLINEATPVTVSFNEGRDSFLTVLLHIDEAAGRVIIDWSGSEDSNRRFLKAERGTCVAHPQGVRHQFSSGPAKAINWSGRPAFSLPLPTQFIRLQRREFFRLVLPVTQRPPVMLTAASPPAPERIEAVDIGLGGLGLEVSTPPTAWEADTVLPKVLIDLGRFGPIVTALRIRHTLPVQRGQRQLTRVGCRFEELSHTQEVEIQRFISHVQREERARLG